MSKETEKKPLSERAPTTGPESSEPGLGSLAPKDGSHQPQPNRLRQASSPPPQAV